MKKLVNLFSIVLLGGILTGCTINMDKAAVTDYIIIESVELMKNDALSFSTEMADIENPCLIIVAPSSKEYYVTGADYDIGVVVANCSDNTYSITINANETGTWNIFSNATIN